MINCNKFTCTLVLLAIVFVTSSSANSDLRDLTAFRFPGPRPSVDDSLATGDPLTAAAARTIVKREPQYEDSPYDYTAAARPATSGYRPSAQQAPSPLPYQQEPRYSPSPAPSAYNAPRSASVRSPSVNYGSSSGSQFASQAGSSASPAAASEEQPEEENKGPSKLELLLAQSKFACDGKKDGYYADTGVGCQVFHYCVQGAKHSWMCPDQTVFHQVHLNCVPAAQDICSQSEKFFVVNDYLHKEIDQRGPNNSVRYHQRYYPEEFLGDAALNLPQSFGFAPNEAPVQSAPQRQQASSANSYAPQRPARPSAYSEESESAPYYKPQSYASSASASQSYKPIATRGNSYSPSASSASAASSSSGYGSTSVPNSALSQYSPSAYSGASASSAASAGLTASRSASPASYPSSYPSSSSSSAGSAYPSSYSAPSQSYSQSPRQSTGLRYAQSSGVPVSYQPSSSRATASSSGSSSSSSPSSSSLYSPVSSLSRPTASPYAPYTTQSSPYSASGAASQSATPSRYSAQPSYSSSYPRTSSLASSSLSSSLPSSSSSSSASQASSPYSPYSPYSPVASANYAAASADPSAALRTRFSSAISTGENYSPITASRFKSGVIYESDY